MEECRKGHFANSTFAASNQSSFEDFDQRTLTVGGRIIVWLVSSLTRLKLTNEGNIILFVFSEAV